MHQLLFSKSSQMGLEKWTGCYWKVSALFTSLFFQRDYRYIPYDLDNLLCLNVFLFADWFAFIGRRAAPNLPGSPYAIKFWPSAPEASGMIPMNVSAYSCADGSLGCSCGDCTSSPVCSSTAPPPHKSSSCSVKMGSLNVRANTIVHQIWLLHSISCLLWMQLSSKCF